MLRMNVSLMEHMRTEYDGLHSRIEVSETRINKELRDKSEEQARHDTTMGGTQHGQVTCQGYQVIREKLYSS
jgi:hypothetical protein